MPRKTDDRPLYVARSRETRHFLCSAGGWTPHLEQCGHFETRSEAREVAREERAVVDIITLDEAASS